MKVVFALCFSLVLAQAAHAARKDFSTTSANIAEKCDFNKNTCNAPFSIKEMKRTSKTESLFKKLDKNSEDLARVWADTILEGDYEAFGSTQADKVTEISQNGKLVAYHVEYFEPAIDTGGNGCKLDDDGVWSHYGLCRVGRIYEGGYVSADLSETAADDTQLATFFGSPKEKETKGFSQ